MDAFLPQMPELAFDRLEPIALEQTLAYFEAHPEPLPEDIAFFCYTNMLDDAVVGNDWLEGIQEETNGQSR
jgi:hypothetical protein